MVIVLLEFSPNYECQPCPYAEYSYEENRHRPMKTRKWIVHIDK